jgi:mono/diheme cytochrome c family protein
MRSLMLASAVLLFATGCGGKESDEAKGEKKENEAAEHADLDPAHITKADLALGDSIFHGLIGATSCQACHGPDAKGGTVAPNLTDTTWLHSDGSFPAIYHQIETGVTAPKQYSGMMPPFGGAPLTPEKHRAVAAYVYSLSHKVGQ